MALSYHLFLCVLLGLLLADAASAEECIFTWWPGCNRPEDRRSQAPYPTTTITDPNTGGIIRLPEPIPGQPWDQIFPNKKDIFPGNPIGAEPIEKTQKEISEINKLRHEEAERNANIEAVLISITGANPTSPSAAYISVPVLVSKLQDAISSRQSGTRSDEPLRFAIIGLQSAGKSTMLNVLTQVHLGHIAHGLGTKAQVLYQLRKTLPEEPATFYFDGAPTTWADIPHRLAAEFAKIPKETVTDRLIEIKINAPWVTYAADIYDLPGWVLNARVSHEQEKRQMVKKIVQERAAEHDLIFLIVLAGDQAAAHNSPELYDILETAKVPKHRVITVLNKVNMVMDLPVQQHEKVEHIEAWLRSIQLGFHAPYLIYLPAMKHKLDEVKKPEEWRAIADDGDQEFAVRFRELRPHITDPTLWPEEKRGAKKLISEIAKLVTKSLIAKLDARVDRYEKEQRATTATKTNVPPRAEILRAAWQFRGKFKEVIEKVALNKDGEAINLINAGGADFFETPEMTRQRNEECQRIFQFANYTDALISSSIKPIERRRLKINVQPDPKPLLGYKAIDRTEWEVLSEALIPYVDFDDRDVDAAIEHSPREKSDNYDAAIPPLVSSAAKHLFHKERINVLAGKMACQVFRMFNHAGWRFSMDSQQDAGMRFLLLTPGFRQIIVDEVLLFLRRKVEIFSHDAEHSLATIIDARRDTALVGRLYKETVKEIFSDISEEAIRAAIQHHAPRGTETIPAEGAQLVDERDLRTKVRNAAKMEYSQRIARAIEQIAAENTYAWRSIHKPDILNPLLDAIDEHLRDPQSLDFDHLQQAQSVDDARNELQKAKSAGLSLLQSKLGAVRAALMSWQPFNEPLPGQDHPISPPVPKVNPPNAPTPNTSDPLSPTDPPQPNNVPSQTPPVVTSSGV